MGISTFSKEMLIYTPISDP